ncbi:PucR family transcriptional regulator ligand-binding domain-containing protein [Leucobacter sp. gxy201]|uniref:PucR family transcriptional regulator n=1 Tax=Leucobacter sp. gxy201 TaxID=2957200 RepID=UPI003D9FB279
MTTLSQLLAAPGLGLRLIQAGPDDPEISWVSITELLALGPYLEGGEVILTTGLSLAHDDRRWHDFTAGLSRARIAAIGFGIGIAHDAVPPALVRAASTYRVALFEVPLPTPFIAVSKAVAELLRSDELRATRSALGAAQRILDASRGEHEPAEVLATMAQATGRHLALIGTDGSRIASTGRYAALASSGAVERIDLDDAGTLQLAVAGSEPLSPSGRSVIAAGAIVLGIGLRGDRADANRERERWERLTAGLLDGSQSPAAAAVLSPDFRLPARVRAVAVQGAAEDVSAWRRRPRTGADRLIAPDPGAHPDASGLALAWQLCADIDDRLQRAIAATAHHGLDAVIGRPVPLEDAAISARSARAGLRSLSLTDPLYETPRTPAAVWADRETPVIEALLELPGAGERLALRVLGALSRGAGDGAETGGDLSTADRATLRDTLVALFTADGQRGPTAAALGIHRNTLRDRIARIERITDRSLASADDRAELWLALRVEELRSPAVG